MAKDDVHGVAERFMGALAAAEQKKDVEPLVALFREDAQLTSMPRHTSEHGRDGARAFWREYLSVFDHVGSEFTRVVAQPDRVVLEWHAEGKLRGGRAISYDGVTVLDIAEGAVAGMRTYYDPTPFVPLAH